MNKCIIFSTDGLLRVLIPIVNIDQSLKQIIESDIPDELEYKIINIDDLPKDRTFRNAWTMDLTIDMESARDIWREKIRQARDKALADLDVPYMRALEENDKREMQTISNKKQTLRILPRVVDLSLYTNPQALKAFWPHELKEYPHGN